MNILVHLYFCKIYTITKEFMLYDMNIHKKKCLEYWRGGGGEFDPKLKEGVSLQSIRFFAHS